jgi:hypothetical protein
MRLRPNMLGAYYTKKAERRKSSRALSYNNGYELRLSRWQASSESLARTRFTPNYDPNIYSGEKRDAESRSQTN